METDNKNTFEVVYAGFIWQAEIVKSILENAEIEVFLKDVLNGTLMPFMVTPGGAGSVKVLVANADYEKALLLVQEFQSE